MVREPLIRRLVVFARRHAWDGAALLLFTVALVAGLGPVLSGAEKFAGALTPGMEAEAQPARTDVARLSMSGFSAGSRYSPQILFPVGGHLFPLWTKRGLGPPPAPVPAAMPTASVLGVPRPDSFNGLPLRTLRPAIALCIDDLGEDLAGTDKAMALPAAVALAFLPYADATPFLAQEAGQKGHVVLAHIPMEALSRTDPGPMALKVGAPDIAARLAWNISRVPGLAGINNHEGSRFTEDADSLAPVMRVLAQKHLFFFDSRTVPDSQIGAAAHGYGVTSAGRDIFLDNTVSEAAVRQQLDALAAAAKQGGTAIAIGHPHDVTLKAIRAWLAEDHGVELVSLPEAMRRKIEALTLTAR